MPAIQLTPAQRKFFRADAHSLSPVVMIGGDGLTPAVLKETDAALKAHGLIKIRVFSDDRSHRETVLSQLSDQLGAAPVQHIGKLLVLWRPLVEKGAETSPEASRKGSSPRVVRVVKAASSPTHRPQVKAVTVLGNQRLTAGGIVKRSKKRVVSQKKRALES
ncbi:MAG: YhbY family RNA-binding protein [Burkholderiales bacterium]